MYHISIISYDIGRTWFPSTLIECGTATYQDSCSSDWWRHIPAIPAPSSPGISHAMVRLGSSNENGAQ